MEFKIVPMSELDQAQLTRVFELFAEGFYFIFSQISKDKAKLRNLFMESFVKEMAIVCLAGDQPAGMIACGNNQKQPVAMQKEACQRIVGRFKGYLVYKFAGPMLSKPKVKGDDEGYLDYLTTDPAFRGKGIGTQLLLHARDNMPYERLSFEVLAKNETAIRLYRKLGFQEVKTKNDLFAQSVGYGKPIIFSVPKQTETAVH